VRYILYTALLYGAVLSQLSAMPAYAAELTRMPALPVPRGGGSLACGEAGRQRAAQTTACTFTVQFR